MKYILFLFLAFILSFICHADFVPFDFSLDRHLLYEGKEAVVDFKYDLQGYEEKDFLVKPLLNNGLVEIYNLCTSSWVGPYVLINELPHIEDEMLIRVKGFNVFRSALSFEIVNTRTGETYLTPSKDIWSLKVYSDYGEKINSRLAEIKLHKEEVPLNGGSLESAQVDSYEEHTLLEKIEQIPLFNLVLLGTSCFLMFFVLALKLELGRKRSGKIIDKKNRTYGVNGKIH